MKKVLVIIIIGLLGVIGYLMEEITRVKNFCNEVVEENCNLKTEVDDCLSYPKYMCDQFSNLELKKRLTSNVQQIEYGYTKPKKKESI